MRRFAVRLLALLLAGCHHGPTPKHAVSSCVARGDARLGEEAVVVASDEPTAAAYAKRMSRGAAKVTTVPSAGDRTKSIVVVTGDPTLPFLRELGLALPVQLEPHAFVFGGKRYGRRSDGIAIAIPSPWVQAQTIDIFLGATPAGLDALMSVPTGDHGYTIAGGYFGVRLEGDLCADDPARWTFHAPFSTDRDASTEARIARMRRVETPHHIVYFDRGSEAERRLSNVTGNLEASLTKAAAALELPMPGDKIADFLWSSLDEMERYTGTRSNAFALPSVHAQHAVVAPGLVALGAHELVHLLAVEQLGRFTYAGLSEGLAVMVDGLWQGRPLSVVASEMKAAGTLPTARATLLGWREIDPDVAYPAAGHLATFLIGRIGMKRYERVYLAGDVRQLESLAGIGLDDLDIAWRNAIE